MTHALKNVRRFASLIIMFAVLLGLAVSPRRSFSQHGPAILDGSQRGSLFDHWPRLKSFSNAGLPAFGSGVPALRPQHGDVGGGAFAVNPIPAAAQAGVGYTWTGAASSDWFTAGNWSPNGVPGTADTATINNGSTVTLSSDTTVANLNFSRGTLSGGGALTVTGTTTVTGDNARCDTNVVTSTLTLTSGDPNLAGSATVTVTGTLTWSRGRMSGPGTTVIAAGATATVGGGSPVHLSEGRTLDNRGTMNMTG